jgi:hypothetical protein
MQSCGHVARVLSAAGSDRILFVCVGRKLQWTEQNDRPFPAARKSVFRSRRVDTDNRR